MRREGHTGFLQELKRASTEMPDQPDQKEKKRQDVIERRYDELLAERERLRQAIDTYPKRIYQAAFFEDGVESRRITESWKTRLRAETQFLDATDTLGIELFVPDLSDQPGYPGTTIEFNPEKMGVDNFITARQVGGLAHFGSRIEIGVQPISLDDQLLTFIQNEKLGSLEEVFVHEMIHTYHFNQSAQAGISPVLTEAQAYFSGLLYNSDSFNVVDIGNVLTRDARDGGLYDFDKNLTRQGLELITELYALGKTDKEIADMIAHADSSDEAAAIEELRTIADDLKDELGLDLLDRQAIGDIYRLHSSNERMKALLILNQTIEQFYTKESLIEMVRKLMRERAGSFGNFILDGKTHQVNLWTEVGIIPDDVHFPYDPGGERHGIGIGRYPKEGSDNEAEYEFTMLHIVATDDHREAGRMTEAETQTALASIRRLHNVLIDESKASIIRVISSIKEGMNSQLVREVIDALLPDSEDKKDYIDTFFKKELPFIEAACDKIKEFDREFIWYASKNSVDVINMRDRKDIKNFLEDDDGPMTLKGQEKILPRFRELVADIDRMIDLLNVRQIDPHHEIISWRDKIDTLLKQRDDNLTELRGLLSN